MSVNTTSDNVKFHSEYKNDTIEGIRVPVDDRKGASLKDRSFALGSQDVNWEKGSVNRAVKAMFEANGGTIDIQDQFNYDNGLMDIYTTNRYVFRDCLYGVNGDARNKTPMDLMSFRGYPTATIKTFKITDVEMNQDTVLTQKTSSKTFSATSDVIPFQTQEDGLGVLPATTDANYVLLCGYIETTYKMPSNDLYIGFKSKIQIEDLVNGGFNNMYSGDFTLDNFMCKTKCTGDGSGTKFYFRVYAEIVNDNLDNGTYTDRIIQLKLEDVYVGSAPDDAIYNQSLFGDTVLDMNVSWNGLRWTSGDEIIGDITPPAQNNTLVFQYFNGGKAFLYFDPSYDANGIKEYELRLHCITSVDDRVLVTQNFLNGMAVTQGETYEFTMIARDYQGNESLPSNVVTVIVENEAKLEKVYMGATGSTNSSTPCIAPNTVTEMYVNDKDDFLSGNGDFLYTEPTGTIKFNGGGLWYSFSRFPQYSITYVMRIANNGLITGYNPCT